MTNHDALLNLLRIIDHMGELLVRHGQALDDGNRETARAHKAAFTAAARNVCAARAALGTPVDLDALTRDLYQRRDMPGAYTEALDDVRHHAGLPRIWLRRMARGYRLFDQSSWDEFKTSPEYRADIEARSR